MPPSSICSCEGVDATASTVSFSTPSQLQIGLGGTVVDSGYEQLHVVGAVNLTGVTLSLIADATPQPGDKFTIVSATSVVGKFNGLPNGSKVTVDGVELTVRYTATTVTLSAGRAAEDIIVLGAEAGAKPRVKVIDALRRRSDHELPGLQLQLPRRSARGRGRYEWRWPGGNHRRAGRRHFVARESVRPRRPRACRFPHHGLCRLQRRRVRRSRRCERRWPRRFDHHAGLPALSSQVKVFKNRVGIVSTNPDPLSNSPIYTFLAFGSTFKGGATVAAGDVTGDGRADIVVGNGPGMSPQVRVFDTSLIDPPPPIGKITLGPFLYQITPFNSTDRGGVFVAVGNVRGDSRAEIIVGNGVNGRGRVEMYNSDGSRFKSFTAYNTGEGSNAPVHVATKNVDLETFDEILTGQGTPGSTGQLRSFKSDGTLNDSIFEGDDDFRFGFFVA